MRNKPCVIVLLCVLILTVGALAWANDNVPYGHMMRHHMWGGPMGGGMMWPMMGPMMGGGMMGPGWGGTGPGWGGPAYGPKGQRWFWEPTDEMIGKMRAIGRLEAELAMALSEENIDVGKVRSMYDKALTLRHELALMQFDQYIQSLTKQQQK